MKRKALSDISIRNVEQHPIGIIIDFNKFSHISFNAKNIANSTLKGNINARHLFNKINIIHTAWKEINSKKVNFYNSDIKDCSIRKSNFDHCNFDGAAHINNNFDNTIFYQCSFNQTSITDSEFRNVTFVECNFTNTIISTSKFSRCKFQKCETSNKLIESSLILDCTFNETNIQVETIIENFGLTINSVKRSKIRIASKGQKKKSIDPIEIASQEFDNLTPIEHFTLSYFYNPLILSEGSDDIDSTFELQNWLKLSKNPNRFRLLIERYHEFIMHSYEKNLAPFWMILKLHSMTSDLTQKIEPSQVEIYRSIMGVHMSLARLIEVYLQICNKTIKAYSQEKEIALLVNGPISDEYYYHELPEIFEGRSTKIKNIIKHNSPNEMYLIWEKVQDLLPIITIILATKVKLDLQQLITSSDSNKISIEEKNTQLTKKSQAQSEYALDIFKTEFGFDKQVNDYVLKLRAILPNNLLVSLQLEIRTRVFGKIKKIILGILPRTSIKERNDS